MQSDEIYLVYKLTYEIYLMLKNNKIGENNYKIYFSKHYIPMIIRFV